MERQQGLCYWTSVPMVPSIESYNLFQPSLDRLDPTRGYDPDNVVLVCWATNAAKGSSSVAEFTRYLLAVKSA